MRVIARRADGRQWSRGWVARARAAPAVAGSRGDKDPGVRCVHEGQLDRVDDVGGAAPTP